MQSNCERILNQQLIFERVNMVYTMQYLQLYADFLFLKIRIWLPEGQVHKTHAPAFQQKYNSANQWTVSDMEAY